MLHIICVVGVEQKGKHATPQIAEIYIIFTEMSTYVIPYLLKNKCFKQTLFVYYMVH